MCTCILVVVILEQKIILMGRPLLHIGFPSLLHLLDNYCTVAMFPSPLWAAPTSTITYQHRIAQYLHTIVCCPVIHNTTLITVVRCVHCHTHTCTHTHTHIYMHTHRYKCQTITCQHRILSKVQMHAVNTCSLSC